MEIKKLTAQVYESSSFTKILGEVLHPGGSELTARMAEIAEINKASLKEPYTTANRGDWLKLFKQGKPGYALIAVTKP